jgi:rhamnosyltransferase
MDGHVSADGAGRRMAPEVSVIIPILNPGAGFRNLLERVCESGPGRNLEILIIDSGSSDGARKAAEDLPVRWIEIDPKSFSHPGTRNRAVSEARGKYMVFLTQDALPCNANWLGALIANFSDPLVAGVYGKQIPGQCKPCEEFFRVHAYPDGWQVKSAPNGREISYKEIFFSNANSACRRDLLLRYPFNEEQIVSEDIEWAKRMLLLQYRIVYEPAAAVYHSHDFGLRQVFRRNFDLGVSLKGIMEDRRRSLIRDGWSYIAREIRWLVARGRYRAIPYLFVYEGFRFGGFLSGRKHRYLPLVITRWLSDHAYHWK